MTSVGTGGYDVRGHGRVTSEGSGGRRQRVREVITSEDTEGYDARGHGRL